MTAWTTKATKAKSNFKKRCLIGVIGILAAAAIPMSAFALKPSSNLGTRSVQDVSTVLTGSVGGVSAGSVRSNGSADLTAVSVASVTNDTGTLQCTSSNLNEAKVFVEQQLQNRVLRLQQLEVQTSRAGSLTSADRWHLQSDLSSELAAMRVLQARVPHDQSCAAIVSDAHTMVYDYRVYLVMTPETDLTIYADTSSANAEKIEHQVPGLQAGIDYAAKHGTNVTQAQQALDNLETETADASGSLQGVTTRVMIQTPLGYPQNQYVFKDARSSCETATSDLEISRADLRTILHVI